MWIRPGRNPSSILYMVGWLLLASTPVSAGDADGQRQIDPICALQTDRYRVQLVKEGRCCPNPMELLYENRQTKEQHSVPFEARVGKSATMRLIDDRRLLITGTLEPGAHSLTVVDLEAGELTAEILSFDYRLSPSKRRIVYSRYQPTETPAADRYPLLVLYDFAQAPTGRPGVMPGKPIFPSANAERGTDELLESGHRLLSPVLWSKDEERVVFFEETDSAHALIVIDLDPVHLHRLPMTLDDLVLEEDQGGSPVVTLAWKDRRTVALQAVIGGEVRDAVAVVLP